MQLYTTDKKEGGIEISYFLDEGDKIIEQINYHQGLDIWFFSWDRTLPMSKSDSTVAIFRITKVK